VAGDNGWDGHPEDQAGTHGYVHIYRDGHAAVVEGFSHAEGVTGDRAAAAGSEPG
jgi:hypothetical protein